MEKIYFGSVKAVSTQYGEMWNIGFSSSDLEKMKENINEAGFVNLTMTKRKELGKHGQTHSISLNPYKKDDSPKIGYKNNEQYF